MSADLLASLAEKQIDPKIMQEARDKFSNLDSNKRQQIEAALGWLFLTEDIKRKTRIDIQKQMKFNDFIALILAMTGILCNIVSSALYIDFNKVISTDGSTFSIQVIPKPSTIITIIRCITSVSTLLLVIFLIRHYFIRLKFLKYKQRVEVTATIFSTKLIYTLILEIIFCLFHSPPYLDDMTVTISTTTGIPTQVDLDLILSSIIPIRVYLLLRYYSFYSSWADDRAEKVCNDCNTLGGITFAIKAELKERPYVVVGVLMVISILFFGYSLRNCEVAFMQNKSSNQFQDWRFVWNGFWCIVITILTVGYGDYYPQTHLGRFIAVISCLWGTFLISLMVVSLTVSVEFTPQEEKAYEELKRNEMDNDLKSKGIKLIKVMMKLRTFPEKREDIVDVNQRASYIKTLEEYRTKLEDFRTMRKHVIAREHEVSVENILHKLNENVCDDMEYLIFNSNEQVSSLIDYIKFSKEIQDEIKTYVLKLEKMTKGLHSCLELKNEN